MTYLLPTYRHSFPPKYHQGFNLVEIMVVISIMAILATMAVPGWQGLQARNAVRAMVNDYQMSLRFARSEAVRLNTPVTVCPSTDGVDCTNSALEQGWIVRVERVATNALLQDTLPRTGVRTRFNNSGLQGRFTFMPNGLPRSTGGLQMTTLWVCPTDPSLGHLSRDLVMNMTLRMRVDSNFRCGIP